MSDKKTLGPEWMLSLAAGGLSPAYQLVVESFLDRAEETKTEIDLATKIGEALFDEIKPATIADDLLQQTLAKLEPNTPPAKHIKADQKLPKPLQEFLQNKYGTTNLSALNWSFLGPGLQKIRLWKGANDERLWLLKGKPGAGIPPHSHRGPELNLVLQGGYQNNGIGFGPGDIEEGDDDDRHELKMDPGEDCICLAATQGPLHIYNLPGKIIQPFLGI